MSSLPHSSSSPLCKSSPSRGSGPSGNTESPSGTDSSVATTTTKHFPPNGLTRSGIACWWSILNLIQDATKAGIPCYLWTFTFAKVYPDSWCGNMHRNLVRCLGDDAKAGKLGKNGFAGVRVTEVHPGGHGIHFHWVVRGKMPLGRVRQRARQCGFGFVFIARDERGRFRRVDVGAAGYVAKYLNKGDKLAGVRSWACIGAYNGTKTVDIEFDSAQNRVFRAAYGTAKLAGSPPSICYQTAVLAARDFAHNADDRDQAGGVGRIQAGAEGTGELAGRETQSGLAGIMGDAPNNHLEARPTREQQRAEDIQRFIAVALSDDRQTV